jgi:hypothetical protein
MFVAPASMLYMKPNQKCAAEALRVQGMKRMKKRRNFALRSQRSLRLCGVQL